MMARSHVSTLLAGALAAAGVGAPARAEAPSKTIDVPTLQKLVNGLGLEDTGDKTSNVVVTGQGSNGYTVSFAPSNDKSYVTISAAWSVIAKDKMPMLPAVKMLEYNITHTFAFALGTTKDNDKYVVLQADVSAQAVSPQSLRQYLDQVVAGADETSDLWDQDRWTPAGGAKKAAN